MSLVPEDTEIQKIENGTPTPKKRGRKRKSEIALQKQLEEIIDSVESTPQEETLSRRGRPRKKVNYYELANPENLDFPVETQAQLKDFNVEEDESVLKKKKVEKIKPKQQPITPEKTEDSLKTETKTPETTKLESFSNGNLQDNSSLKIRHEIVSDSLTENNTLVEETTTSTPNNVKDRKYNYTGETVKMMNTLFNLFSTKPEEQKINESTNNSSNNISPILKPSSNKRPYRKNKNIEIKEEELDDGIGNVTCAICNSAVDRNLWSHHKQRYHNNLAWRVGDEPLDLNDQSFVMHTLNNLYKKKKPLYCDKCGESKKSVVGFLSHRSQCLKSGEQLESVKVACELCGRKMLPVSMSVHMKTVHQNTPEKTKEDTKALNDFNKLPSGKRSAAKKAMKLIENVTKTDSKQQFFTTNLDFGSQEFARTLLQKELDETQFIECKFSCNCITTNMEDALKHFEECTEKPLQGVVCKKCLFLTTKVEDMMQHIEFSHEVNVPAVDDDSNEDMTFTERENKLPTFLYTAVRRTEKVLFPFAFQWTLKFCEENYSDHLFQNLTFQESNWPLLSPDDAKKYLPLMNESCEFARLHVTSFVNPLNRDYTFKKYKLFESEIQDNNKLTLFCGGPISCLAWSPTPYTEENACQVLAVSVFRTPDSRYETYEHYNENSAIQFWNFGKIRNKEFSLQEPELVFNLSISHGPVWHMEWCPSGCCGVGEDGTSRMGLLAVAASDAVVYIYSVPFFSEEQMGLYYKPTPVMKLLLQRPETPLLGRMKYYPTKISWSKYSGHNYIAVGYTNGFVALFNLNVNSVMLRCKDVYGVPCIFPVKFFQAHSHAITALTLYHLNGGCRWLLTGSVDRGVSLWDLNNYGYPICHIKKNTVTDGFWLTNWLCYVTACDEASTASNATTLLKEARDYLYDPNVTLLCSCATINAVAGSDWLNGILHGNSVGELLGIFPHQMFSIPEHNKVLKTKRLLFGYTRLIEKKLTPEERMSNEKLKKKTLQNLSSKKSTQGFKLSTIKPDFNCDNLFVNQPVLYEEAEEKYALVFCDNPMKHHSDFPKDTAKQLTALSKTYETMLPNQYPLSAINKIVFNPNRQASLYFATGYQAGFVRISWLEFLKSDIQIK